MYYNIKPHIPHPDDLTQIRCTHCGWTSKWMTKAEMKDMGVPWYCEQCNKQATKFTVAHPSEIGRLTGRS